MKILFKKLLIVLSIICLSFSYSCSKENDLYSHISELRENIYEAECDFCKIKCFYGFKESPYNSDGKIFNCEYKLTFKLLNTELSPATYYIEFLHDGKTYTDDFTYNTDYNAYVVEFNIENFNEKNFTVKIRKGEKTEELTLESIIPPNTITYKKALDILSESCKDLILAFCDENEKFDGEIHARIIVKDEKVFWYIGLINQTNKKALLIDGKTGDLLAIRTII